MLGSVLVKKVEPGSEIALVDVPPAPFFTYSSVPRVEKVSGPFALDKSPETTQNQPVPVMEIVAKPKEAALRLGHNFKPEISKLAPRLSFHQLSLEGQVFDVDDASLAVNGLLISPSIAYLALVLGVTLAQLLVAALVLSISDKSDVPSAPKTSNSAILNCPVKEEVAIIVIYWAKGNEPSTVVSVDIPSA